MSQKVDCEYDTVEKGFKSTGFGVRHLQSILVFLCLSMVYVMRVDMSVAILAMTDKESHQDNVEIFPWDKSTQDTVSSSFFWGYTLMQIPGGQLAHRYGAKPLLTAAMLVNALISLAFPHLVTWGDWYMACGCRVLQGLTQACFFPCIHTITSKWIPQHERSRLSNFMFAGTSFGTIVGMPLSGILASTSYGWPCIFYTIGGIGLVVASLWMFQGASSPATHAWISEDERNFIQKALGQTEERKPYATPWKSIFTSLPLLAIVVAHVGVNFGFVILLTQIPSYMKMALNIDTTESGLLSALPYTAALFGSITLSFVSDFIINKKIVSIVRARKIFNTIGTWGSAVFLVCLCFIPPGHEVLCVSLITATVGINSGMNMGYMMNHIDLSPNFAGTLMGISNCMANGVALTGPLIVGAILGNQQDDPAKWNIVFYTISGVYFFSNLFFIIFASSTIQPWDEPIKVKSVEFGEVEILSGNDDDKKALKDIENYNIGKEPQSKNGI